MRNRRFLSAVREDKRAFAEKGYGKCAEGKARLMQLAGEKKILYRPGVFSMFATQVRYMRAWEYAVYPAGLFGVLALSAYVQEKGILRPQELFVLVSVWLIVSTACFVGGLEAMAGNHMGELASTCYLNLGQLLCIRLILGAAGQLFALTAFSAVLGRSVGAGGAPMGLYLLLVTLAANAVYFFVFATVRGRGQMPALFGAALLLAVTACFVSIVLEVLFLLSTGVCVVILLAGALVLGSELAYVFHGIKKGELLCFD